MSKGLVYYPLVESQIFPLTDVAEQETTLLWIPAKTTLRVPLEQTKLGHIEMKKKTERNGGVEQIDGGFTIKFTLLTFSTGDVGT